MPCTSLATWSTPARKCACRLVDDRNHRRIPLFTVANQPVHVGEAAGEFCDHGVIGG